MRPITRDRPTEREQPEVTRPTGRSESTSADEEELWLEVQEF